VFSCCHTAATSNFKTVFKLSKTVTETNKMLEMFTDVKLCLVSMSFNGLKCSERDVRTLNMIQGVGSHQLLKIWEQLQKFRISGQRPSRNSKADER